MSNRHYEAPLLRDLGGLSAVTLGQFFSRADGCSGNAGNQGGGGGGITSPPGGCSPNSPGGGG